MPLPSGSQTGTASTPGSLVMRVLPLPSALEALLDQPGEDAWQRFAEGSGAPGGRGAEGRRPARARPGDRRVR